VTWRLAVSVSLALVFGNAGSGHVFTAISSTQHLRDPAVLSSDWLADWLAERATDPDSRTFLIELQLADLESAVAQASRTVPPPRSNVALLLAASTDSDFGYLLKVARRESSLNPWAKSNRSSAAGLFQFTENTWLCTVLSAGVYAGIDDLGGVWRSRDGRCHTASDEDRVRLLALRYDPVTSMRLAGALTRANDAAFIDTFGRPTDRIRKIRSTRFWSVPRDPADCSLPKPTGPPSRKAATLRGSGQSLHFFHEGWTDQDGSRGCSSTTAIVAAVTAPTRWENPRPRHPRRLFTVSGLRYLVDMALFLHMTALSQPAVRGMPCIVRSRP